MTINVTPLPKGPLMVSGNLAELQIAGANGPIDLSGKESVYLCRCGGSVNKPFCDGTHSKIGFEAAEKAVAASG
jgi:CDGSH-type Zn-finger protein